MRNLVGFRCSWKNEHCKMTVNKMNYRKQNEVEIKREKKKNYVDEKSTNIALNQRD